MRKLTAIILLLKAMTGCAGYEIRPIPEGATYNLISADLLGVKVSVCPLKDSELVYTAFDADLLALGVLPVFLSIENRSGEEVAVRRDAAGLFEENRGYTRLAPEEVSQRLLFSPVARYFAWSFGIFGIGIIPGMIDGFNAVEANHKIQRDLLDKALKNCKLSPGVTVRGFAYFEIRGKELPPACIFTFDADARAFKLGLPLD